MDEEDSTASVKSEATIENSVELALSLLNSNDTELIIDTIIQVSLLLLLPLTTHSNN